MISRFEYITLFYYSENSWAKNKEYFISLIQRLSAEFHQDHEDGLAKKVFWPHRGFAPTRNPYSYTEVRISWLYKDSRVMLASL